jgi:hypothetical protein
MRPSARFRPSVPSRRPPRSTPRRLASTLALLTLSLTGCLADVGAPTSDVELDESQLALSAGAQTELLTAFDDAACYCEAYLGAANPSGWLDREVSFDECGDGLMSGYLSRHSSAQRDSRSCASSSAAYGAVPSAATASADGMTNPTINGCALPLQDLTIDPGTVSTVGFCRADFAYCVGQQLRSKAESLVRPPTTREARDAIMAESRMRFALAAQGFVNTLERVDATPTRACPAPGHADPSYQSNGPIPVTYNYNVGKVCHRCGGPVDPDLLKVGGAETQIAPPDCEVCTPNEDAATSQCESLAQARRNELAATPNVSNVWVTQRHTTTRRNDFTGAVVCTVNSSWRLMTAPARDWCNTTRHESEQQRIGGGYAERALARAQDALNQGADLAELETQSRMGTSDALTPYAAGGFDHYATLTWGDGSPRALAANALTGAVLTTSAAPPLPTAFYKPGALRVLELLIAQRIELPYGLCTGTLHDQLQMAEPSAPRRGPRQPLDPRTARIIQPPPDGPPIFVPTPITVESWIGDEAARTAELRSKLPASDLSGFAIQDEDITQAMRLFDDLRKTLDLDYTLKLSAAGSDNCQRSTIVLNQQVTAQRSPLLSAAETASTSLVPLRDEGPQPTYACRPNSAYHPQRAQLAQNGAIGNVAMLRHALRRLGTQTRTRNWASHERVRAMISTADRLVGDSFSEWTGCAAGAPGCGSQPSGTLTLYGTLPAGELSTVSDEAQLRCLLHGHAVGLEGSCDPSSVVTGTRSTFRGVATLSIPFVNLSSTGDSTRIYLLEKTCQGQLCKYNLVDVIRPREAGHVHALGGSLGELYARVTAKTANNPAVPAFNSLGFSPSYVPPVVPGLSQTGEITRESYEVLLDRADVVARDAVTSLTAARDLESSVLRANNRGAIQDQLGTNALSGTLTDLCGPNGSCELPRTSAITLGAMGLVAEPSTTPPPGFGPHATCVEFLRDFRFSAPHENHKAYIAGAVGAALRCTDWAVRLTSARTQLHDVPQPVIEALRSGSTQNPDGLFSPYGGQVREELIRLYQNLDDIRVAMRKFQTQFAIAQLRLEKSVSLIGDLSPSGITVWMCRVGEVLKVVGGVIAVVAAGVAAIVSGGAAAVIAPFISAKGLETLGSGLNTLGGAAEATAKYDQCGTNGDTERAAIDAYMSAVDSCEQMRGLFDESTRRIASTAVSDTHLDTIAQRAALARERSALESALSANGLLDTAARAMQGKNRMDANRKLFLARYYAFAARRALEFRLATELRTMQQALAGREPRTWADDLYTLDSVISGGDAPFSRSAEALQMYLADVRTVADFYKTNYPFAHARDLAILNLSRLIGQADNLSSVVPLLRWKCLNHPVVLPGGHLDPSNEASPPCAELGGVDYMETSIAIPSTFTGYISGRIARGNANMRTDALAVNVYGRNLFECSSSACDDDADVRFDLIHESAVSLLNLAGAMTTWDMGPGVILGARAMSDEHLLVPSTPLVFPYDHYELHDRPLAGRYTLRIHGPAGMHWEAVDKIQLAFRYTYWTPQVAPR